MDFALWYWKVMQYGVPASVPYNLSLNLADSGDKEMAYLTAIDAYIRDHDDSSKLENLRTRASEYGRPISSDDLAPVLAELERAVNDDRYPRRLSADEEGQLASLVLSHPTLESVDAAEELSRPLF